MRTRYRNAAAISVLSLSLLSACGGGGGDSPAPPGNPAAVTSFSLNAGYDARIVSGPDESFAVSGTVNNIVVCTGTATINNDPAVAAPLFETVSGGYSARQFFNISLSGATCPVPGNGSSTGTIYYNASYSTIGFSIDGGGEYAVFSAPPADFPATVSIGNAGTIGTLNTYNSINDRTLNGTRTISYVIEADGTSTSTAVVNITTVNRRSSDNAVLSTQQSRYRMAGDGTLTILSIDVQFAETSTLHLVYTKT